MLFLSTSEDIYHAVPSSCFCCFISAAADYYLLLLPSVAGATIGMAHGTCLICILIACMLLASCGWFVGPFCKTMLKLA